MIACRLDRCGSSVYVQKNLSSTDDGSGGGIRVDGPLALPDVCWFLAAETLK